MTSKVVLLAGLSVWSIAGVWCGLPVRAQGPASAWTASINDVRRVAAAIPGRRPLRINVVKFAESRREHGDHVAGVIRSPLGVPSAAAALGAPLANELAPKTILTRAQVQTLTTNPQMPEIRLTPQTAARYIVVDYDKYLPVAPGIAFIKAPGHTPGSQMVYVVLESGREYVLIGDAAWHMDGVRSITGKDAPWVTEDVSAVMDQLKWLHDLSRAEKTLFIVASHDDEQHRELVKSGTLGGKLE